MKKIIKLFIFLAILFSIFNKQIVSYAALHFFSKWIDREVIVDKFKINYTDSLIVLDKVQIKNSKEFYYNNFVEIDKIILNYNFKSLFTNLIIINNLIFENPTFFLELVEKPSVELSPFNTQKMYDDNVGGVKKIVKTGHDKIWPKKKKRCEFYNIRS